MNQLAPVLGAVPGGAFRFPCGAEVVELRPSGALWVPAARALVAADLHLGKAERLARRGGPLLPPYETEETLERLAAEIAACDPALVVLLGDSFDDPAAAAALAPPARAALAAMGEGRRWVWIAGNHDPAAPGLAGEAAAALRLGGLTLRHEPRPGVAEGEVAGHLHPKATLALRGRRVSRRCAVEDGTRVVLPAFGAYAGGLSAAHPALGALMGREARLLTLGPKVLAFPLAACAP